MNKKEKQFLIWITIAGILFVIVGIHDLFFQTKQVKSGFMIVLEMVAGISFLLTALLKWRRYRQ